MKTHQFYLYIVAILILFGCKPETKKTEPEKHLEKEKTQIQIPKNIDDDFKIFLDYFSKDSVFQVSRVNFPLIVTEIDDENMLEAKEKIIQKNEYTTINFEYPKDALTREFDRYTQNYKIKENKATIEIRGIDNGICSDFFFEKINEKWMLKSWNDSSN